MSAATPRIVWLDYSKGLCIVLVVLMHATLGVEKAAGGLSWLHGFIEWARPFRMPDFFLISGLFLASRIDRPWRGFLDSKLIHFGYFYLLWMSLQVLARGYGLAQQGGARLVAETWATGLVEPFGTLWFMYLLALFFIAAKLLRGVPPVVTLSVAACWQMFHSETGLLIIDEFAGRFVYFYAGLVLAPLVFRFASSVERAVVWKSLAGLALWALVNALFVRSGLAVLPGFGLALGFVGAAAVVAAGVVLAKTRAAAAIGYCGRNSIVIYLAFFAFMAGARSLLLASHAIESLTLIALICTLAGVAGPLLLHQATRGTRLSFLFRRPDWARLGSAAATPRSIHWLRLLNIQTGAQSAVRAP